MITYTTQKESNGSHSNESYRQKGKCSKFLQHSPYDHKKKTPIQPWIGSKPLLESRPSKPSPCCWTKALHKSLENFPLEGSHGKRDENSWRKPHMRPCWTTSIYKYCGMKMDLQGKTKRRRNNRKMQSTISSSKVLSSRRSWLWQNFHPSC